jgi:hypothetical protein
MDSYQISQLAIIFYGEKVICFAKPVFLFKRLVFLFKNNIQSNNVIALALHSFNNVKMRKQKNRNVDVFLLKQLFR